MTARATRVRSRLWHGGNGHASAAFYVTLLLDSRVREAVMGMDTLDIRTAEAAFAGEEETP